MITLSKHILDEMGSRGISLSYIERALVQPDRTTPDPVQPGLSRAYRAVAEFNNRVLRVVYRTDGADFFVVTAHWDRGAKRA